MKSITTGRQVADSSRGDVRFLGAHIRHPQSAGMEVPAPGVMANMTYENKTELWQLRMREVQGAIVVTSVFQFAIGVFGMKLNLVLFPNLRLQKIQGNNH